jgi:hypothetical protein
MDILFFSVYSWLKLLVTQSPSFNETLHRKYFVSIESYTYRIIYWYRITHVMYLTASFRPRTQMGGQFSTRYRIIDLLET